MNLLLQFSTMAGGALVAFGQLNVQLPDPAKQSYLHALQVLAVPAGSFLVGLNTRHP